LSIKFKAAFDKNQLEEFFKVVEELPAKLGRNAFRNSMKKSAKIVQRNAQAELISSSKNATGRLLGAIRVKFIKKYEPIFFKTSVFVNPGKKRDDKSGAYYGWIVERGHRAAGRRKLKRLKNFAADTSVSQVPGKKFMEKGAETSESAVFSDFKRTLKSELQKQWKRIPASKRPSSLGEF